MNELKNRITEAITDIIPNMPQCVEEDAGHTTADGHFGILFLPLNLT